MPDEGETEPTQLIGEDVAKLAELMIRVSTSTAPTPDSNVDPRRQRRHKKGGGGVAAGAGAAGAAATERDTGREATTPTLDGIFRTVSGVLGEGTSTSVTRDDLGWSVESLVSTALTVSDDGLTAVATGSASRNGGGKHDGGSKYGGVTGVVRFHPSTGTHHFCVSVKEPVDDGFWIGICYPEADGFFPDAAPKSNPHCIVWSGGSPGDGGRPGTVRLHTEKFREQPRYAHRAAIGVVVDTDTGDLSFWLDGTKVLEFPGAAVGKVCAPFFSCTGSVVGPAATLMRWPLDRGYVGSERGGNAASAESGATADMVGTIEICGSMLEGGGQVLRVALAAAALTRTPIHVTRIRAGRPNPGLGHQHATGARLVAQGCGAAIDPESLLYGAHLEGVTSMRLWPGVRGVTGGSFVADTHTAGAITLLLQASLPCFLLGQSSEDVHLDLRGGTNVRGAPSIEYFQSVLVPLLEKMGVKKGTITTSVVSRGWYPVGGGQVLIDVTPARQLDAITLMDRGKIAGVRGTVVASFLARKHAKPAAAAVRRAVCAALHGQIQPGQVIIDIVLEDAPEKVTESTVSTAAKSGAVEDDIDRRAPTFRERRQMAKERAAMSDAAMQCQLVLTTTTGAVHAADCLLETAKHRGAVDPDDLAVTAASRLAEAWSSGGCVDEHTMDQLVVFMALACGHSKILCNAESSISSLHLETAIHFTTLITGAAFKIERRGDGTRLVSCKGVGWVNKPEKNCGATSIPHTESSIPIPPQ